jgi:hypothetical protein
MRRRHETEVRRSQCVARVKRVVASGVQESEWRILDTRCFMVGNPFGSCFKFGNWQGRVVSPLHWLFLNPEFFFGKTLRYRRELLPLTSEVLVIFARIVSFTPLDAKGVGYLNENCLF